MRPIIATFALCILSSGASAFSPPHIDTLQNGRSERTTFALDAKKGNKKKGGKKKGGNNQKKSGMEWASGFNLKPFEATGTRELASTAAASFEGRTGKPLTEELKGALDIPKVLWNAPIAMVIVGMQEESGEMIVKYANVAALETVELKPNEYDQFIAPSGPRSEAIKMASPVTVTIDVPGEMKGDKKYEGGYKKKIIRGTNEDNLDTSISIMNAHRWALEKSALIGGKFVTQNVGVAYAWEQWTVGEDTLRSPGGISKPLVKVDDLEGAVAKQGTLIRELKDQGFVNKDPEVQEAVAELLRLKDLLATVS